MLEVSALRMGTFSEHEYNESSCVWGTPCLLCSPPAEALAWCLPQSWHSARIYGVTVTFSDKHRGMDGFSTRNEELEYIIG